MSRNENNTLKLEHSSVKMIKKKESDPSQIKSYRPISLTSVIGKINETIVKNRLYNFLNKNKLLVEFQSGFRHERQTKDNLFQLIQKSLEFFNRNKNKKGRKWKKFCMYFDIASAFDKVWHDDLIYKMDKLNIPKYLTCSVKEFLSNRSFLVDINGSKSQKKFISCGVHQGSVIGPLLFLIYIKDIPSNYCKNKRQSPLFADVLAYFEFYTNEKKLEKSVKKHLRNLELWLNIRRLEMATHKCHYQIINNCKIKPEDISLSKYLTI
jgi:hypothetical protein